MRRPLLAFVPLAAVVFACSSSSSTGRGTPSDSGVDAGSDSSGVTMEAGGTDGGVQGDGEAGGGCPSTNDATGNVGGVSFMSLSAAAVLGLSDPSYPNQVTIVIANVKNVCTLIQSLVANPGQFMANLNQLGLTLGETSATGAPVTVGTYTPSTMPDELTATFVTYDSNCSNTSTEETAGQVVLCSAGPVYSGTFNLTLGTDTLSGSFSAPLCKISPDAGGPPIGDGGLGCRP